MKAAISGAEVRVNDPDDLIDVNTKGAKRPRIGCFEVKANGETVLSLVGLKRPFPKLKALDMEAEAEKAIAALR